jgi:hypothetical protein
MGDPRLVELSELCEYNSFDIVGLYKIGIQMKSLFKGGQRFLESPELAGRNPFAPVGFGVVRVQPASLLRSVVVFSSRRHISTPISYQSRLVVQFVSIGIASISRVPYLNRAIVARGGDVFAIRGPSHTVHLVVMALVGVLQLTYRWMLHLLQYSRSCRNHQSCTRYSYKHVTMRYTTFLHTGSFVHSRREMSVNR